MSAFRNGTRSTTAKGLLSIGELAERTGTAATALRYYDQLGLVQPSVRESGGRRRYAESAVEEVGVVRFLREVGFTLAEVGSFLGVDEMRSRRQLIDRKLDQVVEQQHHLAIARELLEHGRHCPAGDPMRCSRFWSIIDGHRNGASLGQSHAEAHWQNRSASAARAPGESQ